ncbi:MAG: hypothetical protein ACEY3B_04630 [Wolbachia sp.]
MLLSSCDSSKKPGSQCLGTAHWWPKLQRSYSCGMNRGMTVISKHELL